jgi:hypothetical protein
MQERLNRAIPSLPGTEGTLPMGGSWRLNIASGNLIVRVKTPAAGTFDPRPVLTYNSLSSNNVEFGYGWTEMHRQKVTSGPLSADITKGTGAVLTYQKVGVLLAEILSMNRT